MKRYIDAEKLKKDVMSKSSSLISEWDTMGILNTINSQETVDINEFENALNVVLNTVSNIVSESIVLLLDYLKEMNMSDIEAAMQNVLQGEREGEADNENCADNP